MDSKRIGMVERRTPAAMEAPRTVLVVDPDLHDIEGLLEGVDSAIRIVRLEHGLDPFAQISVAMPDTCGVDALHILSHGEPGCLHLVGRRIDADYLAMYGWLLGGVGTVLTDTAMVVLYGCSVAEGTVGRDFLALLEGKFGATVAASSGPVGAASRGGAWEFRDSSGLPVAPLFAEADRAAFSGLLVTLTGTSGNDTLTGAAGIDSLFGGAGNDLLKEGAGNDLFADSVDDHDGDTISDLTFSDTLLITGVDLSALEGTAVGDTPTLDTGKTPSITGGAATARSWVAVYDGTDTRLTIPEATSGDDHIAGTTGDDTISGLAGNDLLSGLAGNDLLAGGAGDEVIALGEGNSLTLRGLSEGSGRFRPPRADTCNRRPAP